MRFYNEMSVCTVHRDRGPRVIVKGARVLLKSPRFLVICEHTILYHCACVINLLSSCFPQKTQVWKRKECAMTFRCDKDKVVGKDGCDKNAVCRKGIDGLDCYCKNGFEGTGLKCASKWHGHFSEYENKTA